MIRRRWFDFDFWTPVMMFFLLVIGLVAIYSATVQSRGLIYFHKQMLWILLGIGVFLLTLFINYERWLIVAPYIYSFAVVALVLTLVFGRRIAGSRSWFVIGPFHLQTAEMAKIAVALMWSRIIGGRPIRRLTQFRPSDLFLTGGIAAVPMGLILLQPDFGTALTFILPLIFVWILMRMPLRYWVLLALSILILIPFGWRHLKPYQQARILVFMQRDNPDARGPGYQVYQSRIALGSGGLLGKGFQRGSQTQLGFVPERHTDFVLTTIGEEWGFVGIAVILLLFILLFYRWFDLALQTPDPSGQMLIITLSAFWIFHVLINAGMVIGWAPVTGLPLPLISYGGSFLMFCMGSAGMILNVYWVRNIIQMKLDTASF